jgi:hypothetical protein
VLVTSTVEEVDRLLETVHNELRIIEGVRHGQEGVAEKPGEKQACSAKAVDDERLSRAQETLKGQDAGENNFACDETHSWSTPAAGFEARPSTGASTVGSHRAFEFQLNAASVR